MFETDFKDFNRFFANAGPTPGRDSMMNSCCSFNVKGLAPVLRVNSLGLLDDLFAIAFSKETVSFVFLVWIIGIP